MPQPKTFAAWALALAIITLSPGAWAAQSNATAAQAVRVGVYNFAPLVFYEDGQARGFFIDMLKDLARQESWTLTFVPGTWDECLVRLEEGRIDLLPSIARTPEREERLRFTEDFLFLDWGVLYRKKGSRLHTVFDLQGKTIAALRGSVYTEKLKTLLEQFGIKAYVVTRHEYAEVLASVARGETDAGVCTNVLGSLLEQRHPVERTDIVFAPIKLHTAVKRGGREDLLPALDRHLADLKARPGSLYYQRRSAWLGLAGEARTPPWLPWALGAGLAALLLLTAFVFFLRLLVARRTRELAASETKYRDIVEMANEGVWTVDDTYRTTYANSVMAALFGCTPAEMLGRKATDFMFPEDLPGQDEMAEHRRRGIDEVYERRFRRCDGKAVWGLVSAKSLRDAQGRFAGAMAMVTDITTRKELETRLGESERHFRTLADSGQALIWTSGPDKLCDYFNEPWLAFTGRSLEQELGNGWTEGVHRDDFQRCLDVYITAFDARERFSMEYRLRHKSGEHRWIVDQGTPRYDSAGVFLGYIGHCLDIHGLKQVEEALRLNQTFTRAVMENLPLGIAVNSVDPTVSFEYMNDNFPRLYRTTREALARPDGFWEAAYEDPEFREEMRARVLADCASGDPERMYWADVPITRKGEPTTFINARNVPLPEHGLMVSTVWDVSERKQAEEELNAIKWLVDREPARASAQQAFGCDNLVALNSSRLILDAVGPDILRDIVQDFMTMLGTSSAVYEKNGDYALGLFASNWCRVMDQASRRLCGGDDDTTALSSGRWLCHESCWTEASKAAIVTGRPADISCHGGLRLYAEPIRAGNEIVGAINFGYGTPPRDRQAIAELAAKYQLDPDELWKLSQEYEHRPDFIIDAAKERLKTSARLIGEIVSRSIVEKDLNLAKEAAEAANRAKSEFLANMSHELRTPMNGVLGMLQLLMMEELKPGQQSYANNAFEAANRLLSLLNDILDFSRIEAGVLRFKQEPFQPTDILAATVGVFGHICSRKGLDLVIRADPGLPAALVGDEARIRQIVFNLVGNAVKFTRRGAIEIDAWHRSPHGHVPDWLYLAVADSGVGIPEAKLGSVFDRFSQADGSYARQFEGAGLGLAIVRRIVESLGGSLCIDTEAGAGTTVVLALPAPVAPGEAVAGPARSETTENEPAEDEPAVPLRILLAEDELIGQLGARVMLERMGHSVVAVNDGRAAVQAALEQEFDCVLMDIQMPEMDGLEATRILRSTSLPGRTERLPVIAMTAYALSGDREKFLAAGMDEYIAKPFQQEDLRAVLQAVAAKRRQGAPH